MSRVPEIQQAITQLSPEQQRELANWFDELLEDAWDVHLEQDIQAGALTT